jgi:hypothetical protein
MIARASDYRVRQIVKAEHCKLLCDRYLDAHFKGTLADERA